MASSHKIMCLNTIKARIWICFRIPPVGLMSAKQVTELHQQKNLKILALWEHENKKSNRNTVSKFKFNFL